MVGQDRMFWVDAGWGWVSGVGRLSGRGGGESGSRAKSGMDCESDPWQVAWTGWHGTPGRKG